MHRNRLVELQAHGECQSEAANEYEGIAAIRGHLTTGMLAEYHGIRYGSASISVDGSVDM